MSAKSIKVRKDGRYLVRYKGKPFYGYSQKEALAKREEYIRQLAIGAVKGPDNPLFRDYAMTWLNTYKCNVSPSCKYAYKVFVKMAISLLGDKPLKEINKTDIVTAYNTLIGSSGSKCKKFSMVVKAIMEAAYDDDLIKRNPCKNVKPPKGPEGSHRCLEDWEKELVIKSLETGHRFAIAAVTMLYTGMRRGEMLALNIDEDVDFENEIIHVHRAIQFNSSMPILSTTKSEAGIRDIPLLPPLKAVLEGRHGLILGRRKDGGYISETILDELIKSYNNLLSRMANGGMQRRWWGKTNEHKAIIENGGTLPPYKEVHIRCHDYRHTYCTMLYEAGIDLKTAQRWMGHADEKMILHVYAHLTDRQEQKSVEKLRAFMGE